MKTRYTLTIDVPDRTGTIRVEPVQKLRQMLKLMLRAFGIRCVSVAETPPPNPPPLACAHASQPTPIQDTQ